MKTNIKSYMVGVAAALLATSCLDKEPTDALLADEAITTVQEANSAVIGIYADFKSSYLYSGQLTLLPDIQADLVYAVNGYTNTYGNIWRWNIVATDSDIEGVYGELYKVISDCNFFFEQVEKWENTIVDDDEYDLLQGYKGEVYFARALAYSELIKCFCKAYDPATAQDELGVVLTTNYAGNEVLSRSSLYDSYQFVLDDLENAAEAMKPDDDETLTASDYYNSYYFTYYAVQALYARVYLYMQEWELAAEAASEVINSGFYSLSNVNNYNYSTTFNDYEYMWNYDDATEIIWKVGFTATSYGGSLGTVFLNYDYTNFLPDYVPGTDALNLYATADLRYSAFFGTATTGYAHGLTWPLLIKYYGNQEFISGYSMYMCNMPKVFRLSEQYLIRAEAYCRLGNFSDASNDMTTLRSARYDDSYSSSVTLTSDNWEDEICDERARELFMEGFRLQDLKRWGRGFEREQQDQSVADGSSLSVDADDPLFVWPIPQHELDLPNSQIEPNGSNN